MNAFYDANGNEGVSRYTWSFVNRILTSALDICLILNPSVNAYRRLDPHFEAPNQIKASAIDRGSMVRIPLGNDKSARVEVRDKYAALKLMSAERNPCSLGTQIKRAEFQFHHEVTNQFLWGQF